MKTLRKLAKNVWQLNIYYFVLLIKAVYFYKKEEKIIKQKKLQEERQKKLALKKEALRLQKEKLRLEKEERLAARNKAKEEQVRIENEVSFKGIFKEGKKYLLK